MFSLDSSREIEWVQQAVPDGVSLQSVYFGLGSGPSAFQVAVASSTHLPSRSELKSLHQGRKGKLTIGLIVVVIFRDQAFLFGPEAEGQPVVLKSKVAERFLNSVLAQPNYLLAYNRSMSLLRSKQSTDFTGFVNSGLFASYLIREKVIDRQDWAEKTSKSKSYAGYRGRKLIEALGFSISNETRETLVLSSEVEQEKVVAIFLDDLESFEGRAQRFQVSPVEWGLMVAVEKGAPWLIAIREDQIRLYPAVDGVGVGQKSQLETFFEIDLLAIDDEHLGFLDLIFSAEALHKTGTTYELLNQSHLYATSLGKRLRERIYDSVVPGLSVAVAERLRELGHNLDQDGLDFAYKISLRVLFRLLFQAYAEDRGLLPAGRNERFDKNSLRSWTESFLANDDSTAWGNSSTIWFDLVQVWNAIDEGNEQMQVPAYNGGLFGSDPELHPAGAVIRQLELKDRDLAPALRALLLDDTEDGVQGPVDFRSLSVREFGTIYEGLLESSLSLASEDLTLDKNSLWVPANNSETVVARAGTVYFHNASGERKATGSYYTPSFVVEHLVRGAVEPAILNHLSKVKSLIQANDLASAYRMFFDFRVADLAMGSGHFLVAAIDNIEMHMRTFLSEPENFIPDVANELARLEQAAHEALGLDAAAFQEIERSSLLRRQIARRCIYGLDINELAVELSRLAIWIHTFVPGLPMSSLDHGLVCANSLTGITSIKEALDVLAPSKGGAEPFFANEIYSQLEKARNLLLDVAEKDEATKREVKEAAQAYKAAHTGAQPAKDIFDVAVAARLRPQEVPVANLLTLEQISEAAKSEQVSNLLEVLKPAHLPYLFPEVFLRDNPGFDALVGNPPFKEAVVEELQFWARRFPGLNALGNSEQSQKIEHFKQSHPDLLESYRASVIFFELIRQTIQLDIFPGMGTGDPDLYRAFSWRFLNLVRLGGTFGIVLPGSTWSTKGGAQWRKTLFSTGRTTVTLAKNDIWLFENVTPGYGFSFVTFLKGGVPEIEIRGVFRTRSEFDSGMLNSATLVSSQQIFDADEEATLPALQSSKEFNLWKKLLQFPPLGDGRLENARRDLKCAPMREIDVNLDGKKLGVFTANSSHDPVYNHLNVGNLSWNPEAGIFSYAELSEYLSRVQREMLQGWRLERSAYSLLPHQDVSDGKHPLLSPRIVFRDVIHASNHRKVWFALAPSKVLLTNKAPYLIFKETDLQAQAYLLGVLSSAPIDWFGHARIGLNLNFFILYTFPVPEWDPQNPMMRRIGELAAGLSLASEGDFGDWSRLSSPIVGPEDRILAQAEIDALASIIFNLDEPDLEVILDPQNPTRSDLKTVLRLREEWLDK